MTHQKSVIIGLAAAFCLLAAGCTVLEVPGAKLKSSFNKRSIGDLEYSSRDTNGVIHMLKMKGVQSDQVSGMEAVAAGLAAGFAKSLTGGISLPVPAPMAPPTNAVLETP